MATAIKITVTITPVNDHFDDKPNTELHFTRDDHDRVVMTVNDRDHDAIVMTDDEVEEVIKSLRMVKVNP